ncbi:hypothetical protein INS49_009043 [Diaporthe citri]|uniref:uncharacterized protein n=1 Tax=Diaporthe citri TaxID=83186 RepID=UPI001C80A742|nr:uncharacterized protein INS49_009043 [Diaporthe citri]KAG6363940.1 hypothetical protein INS49_009043 [Diaporthe citri]
MATSPTPMIKVSVLHDRDQSRDEETCQSFKKRLQEDHLEHLKSGSPAGWDIAPYDAAVIYWTTDLHNVRNMITDPEWEGSVRKFVVDWIDTTKVDVMAGTQTTFIEDGKVV